MIKRYYQDLDKYVKPGKVLVIFGPRRVGKTTLLKNYLKSYEGKYRLDNGDNIRLQADLGSLDYDRILEYVNELDLIAIDEAQNIPNIGKVLKIIVDQYPQKRVIVTGSSSFELAGQVGEPLTGRKRTLKLFPISLLELKYEKTAYDLKNDLESHLVYGLYPSVVTAKSLNQKKILLSEITDSYLLKDILEFEKVKGAKVLLDLLRLIAFQVGSEVSTTELGSKLGIDYKTVKRYLDLFEKSFILYNLRGYSRNLRKEIYKSSKYYFYDNGIRNSLIGNYNKIEERDDLGQLWENYVIIERLKKKNYKNIYSNNYFWRTWDQQEIDWVEERDGKLFGYEIKWNENKKPSAPKDWNQTYKNAFYKIINRKNYLDFVG